MPKKINQFMLLLMVVTVMMSSAIGTTTVYADDGGGTGETSQPAGEEVSSGDEATPPEPSGDEVTPPADEQPVIEEPVIEETVSVAEILEQAPEGTELVVVNETGEIEPLATEAAAEIIVTSDPIWCQEGSDPGSSSGCTLGYSTVAELITNLGSSSGNGTIFFTSIYGVNDVIIDGTTPTLAGLQETLNTLTLQGGWNGSGNVAWGLLGTHGVSGVTTFSVPVTIQNWTGNIFINGIVIESGVTGVEYGLGVDTTGDIVLDNVNVHDTAGSGDGALLSNIAGGDVSIKNSQFNNNGNGLRVESNGTITLNTVVANENSLTGASLNNCLLLGGACQGGNSVSVTSGEFNDNQQTGLIIKAGDDISVDQVTANLNDWQGAQLTSAFTGGNGDVNVSDSDFSSNTQGTGLGINADGSIDLMGVTASDNRSGAALDATDGVVIDTSEFNNNTNTGLHVESGSTVELTTADASGNGNNGAYLVASDDIDVTNSTFNNNVHVASPADPGLYADSSGGNISLTNVIADGNEYGTGAVLKAGGTTGTISVTGGGHFNGNGISGIQAQSSDGNIALTSVTANSNDDFGIQAQSGDGSITLSGVEASLNGIKGAYLSSYGLGNIFINNTSSFVENGSYGIYASASKGSINLNNVTVTGNNVTDYGAVLTTSDGGGIFVQNSSFTLNTAVGLKIIASGEVNLTSVTASQNGGSGVEVYSTYTASCRCPESKVVNVAVNVGGSTFTNNTGGYGLMVKPGPEGTLVFVAPTSTFGGNGLGDFLLDSSDPAECEKCGCDDEKPPVDSKESNIVDVPFKGGAPVELDYESFASTILRLPNGNTAEFVYPEFDGFGNLEGVLEEDLPGKLGAGTDFIDGVNISLTDEDGNIVTNEDGTITIKFNLPEDARGTYSILYWDPTLKDGVGGWVQLPLYEVGTLFPLNPDDSEDGRTVLSGVKQIGDTITVTVNFPGLFILVAQ